MPELWPDIERRAEAGVATSPLTRVVGRHETVVRGAPSRVGRRPALSLGWALLTGLLLIIAIAAGGLVAGAWRIEDLRLPVVPPPAPTAPAPTSAAPTATAPTSAAPTATAPTTTSSPGPSLIACDPVAPEAFRADYPVVIDDATGIVTGCRLGRGLPAGDFTEADVELSNPVASGLRLRALWWIHGCDSRAEVRLARAPQGFTLSVDGRQEGECVPGGSTFVTVDLELARPIAADDVTGSITRTPTTPDESSVPVEPPAPSSAPLGATPACPGATREADIADVSESAGADWVSAPSAQGTDLHRGAIAALTRDLPDTPLAVVRVDASTGAACRLAGLPAGLTVAALDWSPRGDALAISAFDQTTTTGELLVWSAAGIARAWTGPEAPQVGWSPDGWMIAVATRAGGAILNADGSPGTAFEPAGERPSWSPGGSRIALWEPRGPAGPTSDGRTVIVTAADGVSAVLESDGTVPISWLDDQTLLGYKRSRGTLHAIPVDGSGSPRPWPGGAPQISMLQHGGTFVFSPDSSFAALTLPGVEGATELFVVDRRSGGPNEVAGVDGTGRSLAIQGLAWSPDSESIAYSVVEQGSGAMQGLWLVDNDGRDLRQITDRPFVLVDQRAYGDGPDAGSWQPSWRETTGAP